MGRTVPLATFKNLTGSPTLLIATTVPPTPTNKAVAGTVNDAVSLGVTAANLVAGSDLLLLIAYNPIFNEDSDGRHIFPISCST